MNDKPIQVTLSMAKETRNTVRYNADESDDTAAVDSLYLKKYALNGKRPQQIRLTIDLL